jgi:hypothetical protein
VIHLPKATGLQPKRLDRVSSVALFQQAKTILPEQRRLNLAHREKWDAQFLGSQWLGFSTLTIQSFSLGV